MATLSNNARIMPVRLEASPRSCQLVLKGWQERSLGFQLHNVGASEVGVTVGTTGVPNGVSVFVQTSSVLLKAGETVHVAFSVHLEGPATKTISFFPELRFSGTAVKFVIRAVTKEKLDAQEQADREKETIRVCFRLIDGKRTYVETESTAAMAQLMNTFREREGFPKDPNQLRYIFKGKQLEDTGRIHEWGVTDGSRIDVLFRLCGC